MGGGRPRKWSRFKIAEPKNLKARILESSERQSRLKTLGLGGCSFVSGGADAKLLQKPGVKVHFDMGGEKIVVDAVVHYCRFDPRERANLVGLEFKWPTDELRKTFGLLIGKAVSDGNLEQMQVIV